MAAADAGRPRGGAGGGGGVSRFLPGPSHLSPGACPALLERAAVRRLCAQAAARSGGGGRGQGSRRPAVAAGQICTGVFMKKTARKQVDDAVEGPAVIGPDHVRDRVLSARAGARPGWSRLTVYEKEFRL